ncbi:hydroxymethylbilane synthase [Hydromonas duriensis]|uniref:Porphobilinogen deaminase n=1 Tax=Hydromonas duriensis TaxID=1527608 RepID=A0A4R6Y6H1_9BURK|nr:hydroxymethylbilane synthase [Hydromonas duriensis]TDR31143.1 hydroxymethylbilane synthase [Hydromonas duriensis]
MTPLKKITIATRESRLALWQAHFVKAALEHHHPSLTVELLGMTTRGDQILDQSLSKIGGKGLFVKELETALQEGRADLAVHSLKDVPMVLPEGFTLACVMAREDARDAFISNKYSALNELPEGAVVGTSSLRRAAQLRARFPHLSIESLRGNLDTRLRKLDEGQYDAILLAAAGVKRLGMGERIKALLSLDDALPAAGQGALGIEIANGRDDVAALLAPLHDADTFVCTAAERAVSRALGGSCQTPLAAHAILEHQELYLRASLALPDGSRVLTAQARGERSQPESLAQGVVNQLYMQGAQSILDALLASPH